MGSIGKCPYCGGNLYTKEVPERFAYEARQIAKWNIRGFVNEFTQMDELHCTNCNLQIDLPIVFHFEDGNIKITRNRHKIVVDHIKKEGGEYVKKIDKCFH